MSKETILVVDDEEFVCSFCRDVLLGEGYNVLVASDAQGAIDAFNRNNVDLVLTDLRLPGASGIDLLSRLRSFDSDISVILITGYGSVETAVEAIKKGAYDYITKPIEVTRLKITVDRALERKRLLVENELLSKSSFYSGSFGGLVGTSPNMRRLFSVIDKAAKSNGNIIIYGESGTGKELVARSIHNNSDRKENTFVAVNCGAIPETLLESELFGHVKGAFTGAVANKYGLFEAADNGSLFFDEIGELSTAMQVKLLRTLQEKIVVPVGSTEPVKVDVRIIAATNVNLRDAVSAGHFREDLFYRLHVIPIYVPPLRERRTDIPVLIQHFLTKYNREIGKQVVGFTSASIDYLMNYNWPGNVRELENLIQRVVAMHSKDLVVPSMLTELFDCYPQFEKHAAQQDGQPPSDMKSLSELEKQHITQVLRNTKGHRTEAADILGITRRTLYKKIQEYNIDIDNLK